MNQDQPTVTVAVDVSASDSENLSLLAEYKQRDDLDSTYDETDAYVLDARLVVHV
jgi:hypothetical protein